MHRHLPLTSDEKVLAGYSERLPDLQVEYTSLTAQIDARRFFRLAAE